MAHTPLSSPPSPRAASFVLYVAIVLTIAMVLFPPFTSLNGTEYAFLLTGPEWTRLMRTMDSDLGLAARPHWILLSVQLTTVWAIALGARWFFAPKTMPPGSVHLWVVLLLSAGLWSQNPVPAPGLATHLSDHTHSSFYLEVL